MTELPAEGAMVVVDKPAGMTSHDVVARARKALGTRKVGHGGTLDPDATGVLVLGVGRATRLLTFVNGLPKSYTAEIALGAETDTLDAAGTVTATFDMSDVGTDQVIDAARRFVGDIEQVPPMVSAIKVDGKRLHQLAREGVEVERPPRPVTVTRFDVTPVEDGVYRAEVDCSSGTYVRSLAADLGRALGGGAHLRSLRRTAVGPYRLADAHPLDDMVVIPAGAGLPHLPIVAVSDEVATEVGHGQVLAADVLGVTGEGPWQIHDPDGRIVAVSVRHGDGRVKPAVVLRG